MNAPSFCKVDCVHQTPHVVKETSYVSLDQGSDNPYVDCCSLQKHKEQFWHQIYFSLYARYMDSNESQTHVKMNNLGECHIDESKEYQIEVKMRAIGLLERLL